MKITANIDRSARVNLRTPPEVARKGRFFGSLVKERDDLLRKEQLTVTEEDRLDLLDRVIRCNK